MIYFRSQVDALLKAKDEVIEVYRKENDRLRGLLEVEGKRASNAVDRLLNQAAVGSISSGEIRRPRGEEILKSIRAAVGGGQCFDDEKNAAGEGKPEKGGWRGLCGRQG